MNAKRTEGTWSVIVKAHHNKCCDIIAQSKDAAHTIALVGEYWPLEAAGEVLANANLMAAAPSMEDALKAVLLFHSGGEWDSLRRAEWAALTGSSEATTKVLCDTVRAALAKAGGEP